MRIAMWSGPRNLSTALMYAFGNRSDCAVWDEPFYAPYLAATGLGHPMRAEILAAHETDPVRVAARCAGRLAANEPHFYMKHMAHHMLPDFALDWARNCVNIHLIRHPARVVASYGVKHDKMGMADIGFAAQAALHGRIGGLVIDSGDIRADPQGMLEKLCVEIMLPFDPAMLAWPAGARSFDGVWARHWYNAVHLSTGFAGAEGPLPDLSGDARLLVDQAMPHFDRLQRIKIQPHH